MRDWPAFTVHLPASGETGGEVSLADLVAAELDGLSVVAISELSDAAWQVFFRETAERDAAAAVLMDALGSHGLRVDPVDVPDGDWARRTQAALRAIHVGALTVAPPWDPAAQQPDARTLVIEPAMGFGSGHHATTRLCLAALQALDLHGRTVIDIGTGSGVLALAAARLGAGDVLAIDVDEDALDNARTNAALNGNPATVRFAAADFRGERLGPADVVVANLTGGMLLAGVEAIVGCVRPAGTLVLSGITAEEADQVAAAFRARARQVWRGDEDAWCAFTFTL